MLLPWHAAWQQACAGIWCVALHDAESRRANQERQRRHGRGPKSSAALLKMCASLGFASQQLFACCPHLSRAQVTPSGKFEALSFMAACISQCHLHAINRKFPCALNKSCITVPLWPLRHLAKRFLLQGSSGHSKVQPIKSSQRDQPPQWCHYGACDKALLFFVCSHLSF